MTARRGVRRKGSASTANFAILMGLLVIVAIFAGVAFGDKGALDPQLSLRTSGAVQEPSPANEVSSPVASRSAHVHGAATTPTSTLSRQIPGQTTVQSSYETGVPTHPTALAASSAPSFSGHFYAGVWYTGSSTTATTLRVNLQIPDDTPQSGDFYYVILSVWDNAGSYDQVGFTNDYGTWGIAYSTTSYCAGTYYYSPDARSLSPGLTYTFEMSIASGNVHFAVSASGGNTVWSYTATTGGTEFEVATDFSCNSQSWWDYTDYEEVYSTTGPVPPYDFFFDSNWADSFGSVGTWGIFYSSGTETPPSGVSVYINGGGSSNGCPSNCPIEIANEPYYAYFTNGGDSTSAEVHASPIAYYWNVSVAELSSDSPIYVTDYAAPSGWNLVFSPSQGAPPFASELSFSFPSSTSPGRYPIGIVAFDGSGTYSRISLNVHVFPELTVSPSGTPGSGRVDVGQAVAFGSGVNGGSDGYSFAWTGLPSGCVGSDTSTIDCAPSAAGTYPVSVHVTDSLGVSATGSTAFLIQSDPTIAIPAASPASGSVDVGQMARLSTTASGGSGGDSYIWNGLPAGCTTADETELSCVPSIAGDFTVGVSVIDSNGFTATSGPIRLTVFSDPTVGVPIASPGGILEGAGVTFEVTSTPGSGGLNYSWHGLPPGCVSVNLPSLNCTPSSAGTYQIWVAVTDANGFQANGSSLSFTVTPVFLGLPALEGYSLVAAIAAAAIAMVIVIGLRRRKRPVEDISIAEKVRSYSPRQGPAPDAGVLVPAAEVWSDNVPPGVHGSPEEAPTTAEHLVGLDPGSASFAEPLIDPPDPVCWHCHFENAPGSRYCAQCALPLVPPPPSGSGLPD